jgi:hypothetical protein
LGGPACTYTLPQNCRRRVAVPFPHGPVVGRGGGGGGRSGEGWWRLSIDGGKYWRVVVSRWG